MLQKILMQSYHFAAIADLYKANEYPVKTIKTNILGTLNILDLSQN